MLPSPGDGVFENLTIYTEKCNTGRPSRPSSIHQKMHGDQRWVGNVHDGRTQIIVQYGPPCQYPGRPQGSGQNRTTAELCSACRPPATHEEHSLPTVLHFLTSNSPKRCRVPSSFLPFFFGILQGRQLNTLVSRGPCSPTRKSHLSPKVRESGGKWGNLKGKRREIRGNSGEMGLSGVANFAFNRFHHRHYGSLGLASNLARALQMSNEMPHFQRLPNKNCNCRKRVPS